VRVSARRRERVCVRERERARACVCVCVCGRDLLPQCRQPQVTFFSLSSLLLSFLQLIQNVYEPSIRFSKSAAPKGARSRCLPSHLRRRLTSSLRGLACIQGPPPIREMRGTREGLRLENTHLQVLRSSIREFLCSDAVHKADELVPQPQLGNLRIVRERQVLRFSIREFLCSEANHSTLRFRAKMEQSQTF